ncbi:MAG TPA: HAD family phosphatase [Candidatus Monoglobus merdigallinarum]|uniref:HAD family phosphatase n=1 Tax=Candidatus Monoglobus merdigallinarum TaxID=2838698 RepID=A0A9D1TMK7_9FIRM|nr:HAD family phosphatase [Candidatus Monoglobus merdigallinarum]
MDTLLDLNSKQNFIFDLDGTLIDSMWIWDNLLIDFLAQYGYETPNALLSEVAYMSLEQSARRVSELYRLPLSPKEILGAWTDMIYDSYASKITLKPGVFEYLNLLKRQGKKIALATANSAELTAACLKNNGILGCFDVFTYVDEVGAGKSSPKVYLECLRRMNADPADTVLFEDILEALNTAKSIPLDVVIVEDLSAENDKPALMKKADLYIRSFCELL